MADPELTAIVDLKLVAYGNTKQNANGTYTCQHGQGECESDVLELCTQYKLSGNIDSIASGDTSLEAWPFILCMEQAEGDPAKAETCFATSMKGSSLTFDAVSACAQNEASDVQAAAAKATPSHDFVPWCLVNGQALQHPDQMLTRSVCNAYTGPKPSACKLLGASEEDLRCYPTRE